MNEMAVKPLSAVEMFTWMEEGKDALFLDVRSQKEFEDWRIQVTSIPQVCIPSGEFEDESKQAWETLPKDKPINVICRRGRTARIVAEQLDAKGYDVYVLDKGMQEWSQFYNAVTVAEEGGWKLVQIQRLGKGCLSYMLLSGGEAMIVDPGRHTEEYLNLAAQEEVNITCVMDTHLHADHISGAVEIAGKTGARYFISSQEMQDSNLPYEPVEDNEVFKLGEVEIKVLLIPTPGHTPGSVSFLVNDTYLLSGDTIFVGGLGRPDLGGKAREWAQKLYDTVFHSIAKLADDIVVLPSHFSGPEEFCEAGYVGATLGTIRANNEAMRTEDREAFADLVAGRVGATPPNYTEIVEINRGHVMADDDKKLELEVGPNRCAVKHSS
jgi:glyoxylase-like metal-dependent hydrolase (beta-lactamase superfamily II)/rhodanese-related sulfurtransferase